MILITGSSGLLGANMLLHATTLGREVVGLSHRQMLAVPHTRTYQVDLTNSGKVRELVNGLQPDIIIHCAAATDVDWCEQHPVEAEDINASASGVLAEIAAQLDARFVYISTDSVFDGVDGNYRETDSPAPVNVYARTKLEGEKRVMRSNPRSLIIRTNLYGWNAQPKYSLAEWILAELTAGRTVPGFCDVYFCPMLANHLAETVLALVDGHRSGIFHVAGSERISKYDFARRLAELFGFEAARVIPKSIGEAKLVARRPLDISLCTAKIKETLGTEMPDVQAGLRRFADQRQDGYPQQLNRYVAQGVA